MPEDCILEVILGKNISEKNKNEICELTQKKYSKAIVIDMSNA